MNKVTTCVYAIALNEAHHVDVFMDSCAGADLVLVCDTGSTDDTVDRLRARGAIVHTITQRPWRFDVPRNTALGLVPADIDVCLSIDLDEHLQPGWVDALDAVWQQTAGKQTRFAYDYIWSWKSDGVTPDVRFNADKIHHRRGYRWHHPCHETLYWEGEGAEQTGVVPGLILHHRPDPTKSRGQYLPLLEMAVREAPTNDRMAHYYARELMFHGKFADAIVEFQRHLHLPHAKWREERSASMRYIARCKLQLGQAVESIEWGIRAVVECPHHREPWFDLASNAHAVGDYRTGFWAISKMLDIRTRTASYMGNGACWGESPYDIGAICAYQLGLFHQAREWGLIATQMSSDSRIHQNLVFYNEAISKLSHK